MPEIFFLGHALSFILFLNILINDNALNFGTIELSFVKGIVMKRLLSFFLIVSCQCAFATEQAEEIFKQLAPSLYQIRLIDNASGEKSSIGSGFQISKDGLIATNYHVISGYALYPEKYQMQYLDNQGNKGKLTLKSVDVIHDLAIVQRETSGDMAYFDIATQNPIKGEELYSLGNPHDLGMIVVPGTYNGLKKESFNDKIHFTGSVNQGMSGGPVVNANGEVVGVNVATSGNQIGFLVPHQKLQMLFTQLMIDPPSSINLQMSEQLSASQSELISTLLDSPWQNKTLGKASVPIIDVPFMRCWGNSNAEKQDAIVLSVMANCTLEEHTFISSQFYTSTIEMEYHYLDAKSLPPLKFYHLYQEQIKRAGPGNKARKENVTEYQCHHDLVKPDNQAINMKSVLCTRNYKRFPQLYDVLYIAGSIDKNKEALISHFTLAGVEQDSAMAFTKKFMEATAWK